MKFKLLSIGQKFEYDGESYIKTSPLIANNLKTSANKMIPRYATLKLLDDTGSHQQIDRKDINSHDILNSFNHFYEKCITTLEENNVLIPSIKNQLDKARDDFTKYLI